MRVPVLMQRKNNSVRSISLIPCAMFWPIRGDSPAGWRGDDEKRTKGSRRGISSRTTVTSSGLPSWQLGLICASSRSRRRRTMSDLVLLLLGILILCLIIFLLGCFYRRCKHSKRLTISQLNLVEDGISVHSAPPPPAVQVLRHSSTSNGDTR